MVNGYLLKHEEMFNVPVAVEQSRTISPGEEDAWMSICIRARDFSRGPRQGVDPSISWSYLDTKF